ncbi:hypothetical protein [Leptolyngbya sp. PCC 6406]|uniref:hypothetical protein n=1 Tax=Leptolyngbya sp. PCC 6406 TaxID=1173264 RepID=UPI0002ACFB67|nr:hypothetical protein [Leptolyngbya sp. PCC 6406]
MTPSNYRIQLRPGTDLEQSLFEFLKHSKSISNTHIVSTLSTFYLVEYLYLNPDRVSPQEQQYLVLSSYENIRARLELIQNLFPELIRSRSGSFYPAKQVTIPDKMPRSYPSQSPIPSSASKAQYSQGNQSDSTSTPEVDLAHQTRHSTEQSSPSDLFDLSDVTFQTDDASQYLEKHFQSSDQLN